MKTGKTSASLNLVISMTFWDGPGGLPADLDIPLFDGDLNWNNDMAGAGAYEILENPVPDDSYIEKFGEDFSEVKGYGFQIHKGNITIDLNIYTLILDG